MILLIARWYISIFLKLSITRKTKKYKLQILQHNIRYSNIIIIKDVIILEKARKKQMLSDDIADTTILADMP